MRGEFPRESREYRPRAEPMEARLVLSTASVVAAEVRGILARATGGVPLRPNTPVLPLESAAATASFIDPSTQILRGDRIRVGQRDYIAPFASLDSRAGYIQIGSATTIQDNASLVANPTRANAVSGIVIGDSVVVAPGVKITGPAAIGATGGAVTAIGANAVIAGGVVQAGAFVGVLARVGPGVTINTGFAVLPGMNVTTQAEATNPALGKVVRVSAADPLVTAATASVARTTALAAAYTNLYQGQAATGPGTTSGGPIPAATTTTGIFFGALNNVLGASPEPTTMRAAFEPTTGTPTFQAADGLNAPLPQQLAYLFPARVIGQVVIGQDGASAAKAVGKRDSIRADEGQAFTFLGPIARLGSAVTFHSPNGGLRSTTTTTVVTTTTAAGVTTTTTNATTSTASAASSATAGTTTTTTAGTNAAGVATTGTVTTTIANTNYQVGGITVGTNFRAGDHATILGGPSLTTTFGSNDTIGSGAVVDTSVLGDNVTIGNRAYIAGSTIPAGSVVPAGAIIINNQFVGFVQG